MGVEFCAFMLVVFMLGIFDIGGRGIGLDWDNGETIMFDARPLIGSN